MTTSVNTLTATAITTTIITITATTIVIIASPANNTTITYHDFYC